MTSRFDKFLPLAKKLVASVSIASSVAFVPLAANGQTVIGKRESGSVTIDLSVLEEFGRLATVPQLVRPSVRKLSMPNAPTTTNGSRFRAGLNPAANAGSVKLIPPPAKRRTPKSRRAATRLTPRPSVTKPAAPKIAPQPPPAVPALSSPAAAISATPTPPPPKTARPVVLAKTPTPPPPSRASKQPAQMAAITPAPETTVKLLPGQQYRIGFAPNAAAIGSGGGSELDGIAKSMRGDGALRLRLLAYAGGAAQTPSQARRLSLSRALAVRAYLIEKGIRSTRIDVRALGNKSEGGPPDRVDIIITTR